MLGIINCNNMLLYVYKEEEERFLFFLGGWSFFVGEYQFLPLIEHIPTHLCSKGRVFPRRASPDRTI